MILIMQRGDIMQLCDKDIIDALIRGELIFLGMNKNYPFIPEKQIQPASVDLRLGNRFVRFKENISSFDIRDIKNIDNYLNEVVLGDKESYVIPPHEVVYCHVYEQMSIGDCYGARIEGRSRVARLGLSIHCTGDYINPGFMGSMPLQIVNHNYFPITIYPYMPICQIIIYELTQEPLITYAEKSTLSTNKYYNEKYPGPSVLSCDENSTSDLPSLIMEEKIRKLIQGYNASFPHTNNKNSKSSGITNLTQNYFENLNSMEVSMRDTYNAKQAGIQGANAGQYATVYQNYNEGQAENIDYNTIINEIAAIKKYLKNTDADDDSNDILIGELTKISHAAEEKNHNKMVSILKTCAKEVYDIAKKVGCSVLAKYISTTIGI